MVKTAFVISAAALLLGSAAQSQVNPAGLRWGPAPPSLPRGAQLAVLAGDPQSAGMFTIRLRFPPGYSVAPHSHPTDEFVTVISGQMGLGMGSRMDRARATRLVPGGFVIAPANMNHYAFTRTGAVIQITAHGPFAVTYVNPADDPRLRR
ncbi:MAG TPA: cupin domain-containing protein [Sphingomicrobium sp.]|nr:cupin domain-containing protein [Sphingomicrobium sp.]